MTFRQNGQQTGERQAGLDFLIFDVFIEFKFKKKIGIFLNSSLISHIQCHTQRP